VAPVTTPPPKDTTSPVPTVSPYLVKARETHAFITAQLLTPYGSYRANTTTEVNSSFEWYTVSHLYADAAMVALGDSSYAESMNRTFQWMENMWDGSQVHGGYFGYARPDGTGASGIKYIDDNSLTGMVFLEAYDVTRGAQQAAYLNKARACADWVINSGLWDTTFGGGFWWNTEKQYKPTQSNGLALQLFLRLYELTGETYYRDWAISVNSWLTNRLYDPSSGLFLWQFDNTGKKYTEIFTYDNAIMVEAYLLYSQVMHDDTYLSRAQTLGRAMNQTLWNPIHNVYIFNTADLRVNGAWCGWASQAMIKLYEADGNAQWLAYAKGNIDAINRVLRNPTSFGYYQFAGLDGGGRYANLEGVDQAWMQRVQALLSPYR
jgi:uncharacterized protein YyaL (SSP411 family)